MKTTAERLSESFCKPRMEEEWRELKCLPYQHSAVYCIAEDGRARGTVWPKSTEIPVTQFLDLLHDRIVPWRLEEDGFIIDQSGSLSLDITHDEIKCEIYIEKGQYKYLVVNGSMMYLKFTTYTDLIHLI